LGGAVGGGLGGFEVLVDGNILRLRGSLNTIHHCVHLFLILCLIILGGRFEDGERRLDGWKGWENSTPLAGKAVKARIL